MHQAESSSSLFCLWTGRSLPAAPHPVSRRRSCLPLRTDQCFCPMGTFTPLLVRTFRRTSSAAFGVSRDDSQRRPSGEGVFDDYPGFARPATSLYRRTNFRPDEWLPESVVFDIGAKTRESVAKSIKTFGEVNFAFCIDG